MWELICTGMPTQSGSKIYYALHFDIILNPRSMEIVVQKFYQKYLQVEKEIFICPLSAAGQQSVPDNSNIIRKNRGGR